MVTKKPKITEELLPELKKINEERDKKIEAGLIPLMKWCLRCHYPDCDYKIREDEYGTKCPVGIDEHYEEIGDVPDWAKEGYVKGA